MSQHDNVLKLIRDLLGVETRDFTVSGYTGHALPDGRYFYVGTPKGEGPVRITTCEEIPGRQPPWMPRGTVRSAFLSTDEEAIQLMVAALKAPGAKPGRRAPAKPAVTSPVAPVAVVAAQPTQAAHDAELASAFDVSEEELDGLAPLGNN